MANGIQQHLSAMSISAFVDDQLPEPDRLEIAAHIESCARCAAEVVQTSQLKGAVAEAGSVYPAPMSLLEKTVFRRETRPPTWAIQWWRGLGLAAAGVLLVFLGLAAGYRLEMRSQQHQALLAEMIDQHVAGMAVNAPQVISSDRHTVKPWFAGKLPFSFNLPDHLPTDVLLTGGDLTYLQGRPAALLQYNLGRHRASVLIYQAEGASAMISGGASGFQVRTGRAGTLLVTAVSDAAPSSVEELEKLLVAAQS